MSFFEKHKKDIVGIALLFAGAFFALGLFSYNPDDPSINSLSSLSRVTNYCGYVGSFLSDLLYQGFGLGSWLLIGYLAALSYKAFKHQELSLKNSRTAWAVVAFLFFISTLSLYFPEIKIYKNQIWLGGSLGVLIAKGLAKALNFAGASILLLAVGLILIVFYSEKTVGELSRFIVAQFKKAKLANTIFYKIAQSIERRPMLAGAGAGALPKESFPEARRVGSSPTKETEVPDIDITDYNPEEEESAQEVKTPELVRPRRRVIMKAKPPRKIENWEMPKLSLLEDPPASRARIDKEELRKKAELLTDKLKRFSVDGAVTAVKPGPAVTMFEFKPSADVKLSNITSLENDLAIALSSESLRIIAPIPGRDVVGIESSNSVRETVYLKDLLADDEFWKEDVRLPVPLGRQANGDPQIVDLRKMPHLLVAGSTGSGKSVFTVGTITGLLFRHSPKTLKMILIDPKQVDLAAFNKIPHLLMPPIVEPHKAVAALRWAVKEMEKRYRSMSKFGARGLEAFNETVTKLTPEQMQEHDKNNEEFEAQNKKNNLYYYQQLPYIVIVVEEFGDLMQVDNKNVEQAVVRLAQLARACGIHLILCMQSPRKEVVTGLIKTNIPGRISFKVASKTDSRIILDEVGGERLLARGDMLFRAPGTDKPARHHGPWVSDPEINKVAKFWGDQAEPEFDVNAMKALDGGSETSGGFSGGDLGGDDYEPDQDSMYDEILDYVSTLKEVSASLLQRKYRLGYPRAARLIEILEKERVVGPANGSKPRQVLVTSYKE